jgi:hypothetical protein
MMKKALIIVITLTLLSAQSLMAAQFDFINQTHTWDGSASGYNLTEMGPTNWVSPVNYVDGRVYIRYELVQRPSDKVVACQLCMWQDSWTKESCCQCFNTKPIQVYYHDAGTPSGWWRKSPLDYTRAFQRVSFMHKDLSCSGMLLMSSSCGSHCYQGGDLNQHVPITFKLHVIVVSAGATLVAPPSWAGSPWGGADEIPPTLVSASCSSPNQVKATFSEPLSASTAQNTANYDINNGISVTGAALSGKVVTLTTSTLSESVTYMLSVSNVKDPSGNTIVAANAKKPFQYTPFHGWQDDFDDGNADGWTTGEGSWSVSGSAYTNSGSGRTSSWAGETDWADISFSADVTPQSGTDVWMIFRVQDASNYYLFTLQGSGRLFPQAIPTT